MAVGKITKQNTTKDVKPGEVKRQSDKFKLGLNSNEQPKLLHNNLKNARR